MKIWLDNIIFSLQTAGGISVVWNNLIKNIINITDNVRFLEYSNAKNNIFRKSLKIDETSISIINRIPTLLDYFSHPSTESGSPYIFHSSYFRTSKDPHAINVTTVHDFIYEQGKTNLKQKIRIHLNYKAIRDSDAIVCISENTKKDLLHFVPDIDPNKVYVIHNGVSKEYYYLKSKPYPELSEAVLFVGGRDGYKNFDFVVESLKQTKYSLLICGKSLSNKELLNLNNKLPNRYHFIPFPSNEQLNKIYNSVYALAYPSSYEGFGLPVLEAQRVGCPVIALNASSIPEIIGQTPLLLDNLTEGEFVNKLDLLKNETIRKNVIKNGLINSLKFSWERMAEEYYKLYIKLFEEKTGNSPSKISK